MKASTLRLLREAIVRAVRKAKLSEQLAGLSGREAGKPLLEALTLTGAKAQRLQTLLSACLDLQAQVTVVGLAPENGLVVRTVLDGEHADAHQAPVVRRLGADELSLNGEGQLELVNRAEVLREVSHDSGDHLRSKGAGRLAVGLLPYRRRAGGKSTNEKAKDLLNAENRFGRIAKRMRMRYSLLGATTQTDIGG